jgi:hypothetical protein
VKLEPHLPRLRKEISPTILQNAEWIGAQSATAKVRLEIVRKRVASMMAAGQGPDAIRAARRSQ